MIYSEVSRKAKLFQSKASF